MKIETSNERYNRVLEFFKEELSKNPTVQPDNCWQQQHTNFSGMQTWFHRYGICLKELHEAAKAYMRKSSEIIQLFNI